MSKKITVSFYDACLPDYFGGHHRPVLQVPVDGKTTRHELFIGLCDEVGSGIIDYQIDENQLDYDDIRQAIKNCIFWNDNCKADDIAFPHLPAYEELESDDCSVYAFFIVDWE